MSKSRTFWRNAARTTQTGDFGGKKGQTASACRNAPTADQPRDTGIYAPGGDGWWANWTVGTVCD